MIPASDPHLQYLAMIACRRSAAESRFRSNSRNARSISAVRCNPSMALIAAKLWRPILNPPAIRVTSAAEPFLRRGPDFPDPDARFAGCLRLELAFIAREYRILLLPTTPRPSWTPAP